MIRAFSHFVLALVVVVFSCVEPYAPPISDAEASSTIVVDGLINASTNIATVKLSFATALADSKATQKLSKAHVWIEDEDQNRINLFEKETGIYQNVGTTFDKQKKYRLHVDRGTGTDYNSDYIEVYSTPPIDSITWDTDDLDVLMYVTTHDPENKATYFKWDFLETYEYSAPLESKYKIVNHEAVYRPVNESIFICWQTDPSQNILTNSVEHLTDKVVYKYPIQRLAGDDIKLWRVYSILVRQQTISKDAYVYWSTLKKTTESLGGLFDAMPTEVRGNVHSSKPDELVFGYFSASEVTEKRMFITFYDLPDPILHLIRKKECYAWVILPNEVKTLDQRVLIKEALTNLLGDIVAYVVAYDNCLDCSKYRKGTLQKPDYWLDNPL